MNSATANGLCYKDGSFQLVKDSCAVEVALRISINDTPFTVTMQTPGFEKELVRGLLYTEGILTDVLNYPQVNVVETDQDGNISGVNVLLDQEKLLKPFSDMRNLTSVSSCGLCGKTEIGELIPRRMTSGNVVLQPERFQSAFELMRKHQSAFDQSGGTHAAAAFDINGSMLDVKEDIGRHNAVDKVIGSLLLNHQLNQAACLIVSGRISYEIVAKCLSAGIPILASVSAPSDLAIRTSKENGLTLVAFCRGEKFTVYSHPERVSGAVPLEALN